MKTLKAILVSFLLSSMAMLLVTITAFATDGYTVSGAVMENNAVTVNVMAKADCKLLVALYDASGKLIALSSSSIASTTGTQTVLSYSDVIPEGSYAKAFLLNNESFEPLCNYADTRDDSNVYAILYEGGELVLQHGDTLESGKTVNKMREVNLERDSFVEDFGGMTTVRFADKIRPKSTAYWFDSCQKLTTIENIENLDTSQVTNMDVMFRWCDSLTDLDLSTFNTANVTSMLAMFWGCSKLKKLDISSFDTSNVENMGAMFSSCESLTELDLSNFNTSHVTSMGNVTMGTGMFAGCSSLTALDLSSFDTSQVTSMMYMFWDCTSLKNLNISSFDTSKVKNMRYMFAGCSNLTELDLSNFVTSNVDNYGNEEGIPGMVSMFQDCSNLTKLDLSSFDTSNVCAMYNMFSGCTKLTELNLLSFDTSNVWSVSEMFSDCTSLTELDLSSFDTGMVSYSSKMFSGCSNLTTIYASNRFMIDETKEYYSVSDNQSLFTSCVSLVGGAGTVFDANHIDANYAHVDGGGSNPGYFTTKF